jgi:hypothetical protein
MVLGQRLGGGNQTDVDVFNAIDTMADANTWIRTSATTPTSRQPPDALGVDDHPCA